MIWVLFILAIVDGQPVVKAIPVQDHVTCESLKAEAVEVLLQNNVTEASLTCFEATPGKFV